MLQEEHAAPVLAQFALLYQFGVNSLSATLPYSLGSPHRAANKRLIMKSVPPHDLKDTVDPDVFYVLTGEAAAEEEKSQIDALHAVQSLDGFDRKLHGMVSPSYEDKPKLSLLVRCYLPRYFDSTLHLSCRIHLLYPTVCRIDGLERRLDFRDLHSSIPAYGPKTSQPFPKSDPRREGDRRNRHRVGKVRRAIAPGLEWQ